jgi:hypothetical protein
VRHGEEGDGSAADEGRSRQQGRREGGRWRRGLHADHNVLVDARLFHDGSGHDTLRGGGSESEVKVEERSGISHILPDGGMAVLRSHVSGQLGNAWRGPLLRMGLPLPYCTACR